MDVIHLRINNEQEEYVDYQDVDDSYDDPYGRRPDTHTSHNLIDAVIVNDDDYYDVAVVGDRNDIVNNGVAILAVIYTTGDSFGTDYGGGIEYVAAAPVTDNEQLKILQENVRKILEDDKQRRASDCCSVKLSFYDHNGNVVERIVHAPWKGYFEEIVDVRIEILPVKEKDND